MTLHPPCIITARLLPGLPVGGGSISIEYAGHTDDDRRRYRVFVDAPGLEGGEYEDTSLSSGVGGGTLQEGLSSFLSFLCYEVEREAYWSRRPEGDQDRDARLFPPHVVAWATEHDLELQDLHLWLEETPNAIQEYTS